jgi:putative ABC transport system permease protein
VQLLDQRAAGHQEEHAMEFGLDSVAYLEKIIKEDEDVDYVLPRIEFGGLISNGDRSVPFKGYGEDPEKEMRLWGGMSEINPKLKLGEQLLPLRTGKQGIILGKALANSLHVKVGDMMMMYGMTADGAINGIDVELLGIMSTGVSETDKYYLLTNIDIAQKIIGTHKISFLSVMFRNRKNFEEKLRMLKSRIEKNGGASNLRLLPWNEQASFYVSIRDIFNIIFGFMGTIILVIVLLSCWNIMSMTTMERIREIGTLRAIGLSTRNITGIFVLEAFLIGSIGTAIGMMVQLMLSRIVNSLHIMMPPVPGMSRPYTLQVYAGTWLHPWVALGIIAAIGISSFSSLIIIKRFSIVESLEHT